MADTIRAGTTAKTPSARDRAVRMTAGGTAALAMLAASTGSASLAGAAVKTRSACRPPRQPVRLASANAAAHR